MFQRVKDFSKRLKTFFANKIILFPYNKNLKQSLLASFMLMLIFIMVGWFLVLLDEVVYLYFTFTIVTAFAVIYYSYLNFINSKNNTDNIESLKQELIYQTLLILGTHLLTGILLFNYVFQTIGSISITIMLLILFTGIVIYSFIYNRKLIKNAKKHKPSILLSIFFHGLFHYFIFMTVIYVFNIENILLLFIVAYAFIILIQYLKDLYQKLNPVYGNYGFSFALITVCIIAFVSIWFTTESVKINIFNNSRDIVSSRVVINDFSTSSQKDIDWNDLISKVNQNNGTVSIDEFNIYYTDSYIYSVLTYDKVLDYSTNDEVGYILIDIYNLDLEYIDSLNASIYDKDYQVSIIDDQLYILEYDILQNLDSVVYKIFENNSTFSIEEVSRYDFYISSINRAFIVDDVLNIAVGKSPTGIIELPNQANIIYNYSELDNQVIYQSDKELFIEKDDQIMYMNYSAQQYFYQDDSNHFDYYLFYNNGYILRYETYNKTANVYTVEEYLNDEQGVKLIFNGLEFQFFGNRFFHIDNKFYLSLDYLYSFNMNGYMIDRVEKDFFIFQEANNNLYSSRIDFAKGEVTINKVELEYFNTNYMQKAMLDKNIVWFYVIYYLLALNIKTDNPFKRIRKSHSE